mmetsp:Transcript_44399/g.141249  ORF Transcript_44399/g.141249 Transcript_44399/m.141249 type:complete len:220 (-) Transcript_44399:2162-2821(-)
MDTTSNCCCCCSLVLPRGHRLPAQAPARTPCVGAGPSGSQGAVRAPRRGARRRPSRWKGDCGLAAARGVLVAAIGEQLGLQAAARHAAQLLLDFALPAALRDAAVEEHVLRSRHALQHDAAVWSHEIAVAGDDLCLLIGLADVHRRFQVRVDQAIPCVSSRQMARMCQVAGVEGHKQGRGPVGRAPPHAGTAGAGDPGILADARCAAVALCDDARGTGC